MVYEYQEYVLSLFMRATVASESSSLTISGTNTAPLFEYQGFNTIPHRFKLDSFFFSVAASFHTFLNVIF